MIKVEHLYKSFEDREVLQDINATFRDGEVNLIIGQSGSGKTVLMKNIVGLLTPTKGSIYYDDRDFVSLSKKEKSPSDMSVILPRRKPLRITSLIQELTTHFPSFFSATRICPASSWRRTS